MVFAVNIKRCFRIRKDFTNTVGPNFFQLGELLVQHTDPNRLTVLNTTLGRFDISRHQTKQCGFSCTVGSENAGPLPRSKTPCDITQHFALPEAHADIFNIYDVFAQAGYRKAFEFDGIPYRWNIFDQLVCCIHAEFWLGGSGRGTTAQPGQFFTENILAFGFTGCCHAVTFDTLQDIRCIATFEGVDDTIVNFPSLVTDLIQEPPIVSDHQQTAGIVCPSPFHMLGQPGDAFDVQVVRWFIKGQNIPVTDQQLS